MKIEVQGDRECSLATLAALSGKPLAEIRRKAFSMSNNKAWWMIHNSSQFWSCLRLLAKTLRLAKVINEWHRVCSDKFVPTGSTKPKVLPSGRGTIIVKSFGCSHVMPYEDGFIYDPLDGKKYTLAEYYEQHPTISSYVILPIKKV